MLVAGVDFSGAKTIPNDTWLVVGELGSLGLNILSVKNTGSHGLAAELDSIADLRACGMDFPFSFPIEFLRFLARKLGVDEFEEWQQVAEKLVFMGYDTFKALVDEYEIEPKRFTDKLATRQAKSPLHQVNPSMVPMTFYGMRLLATLNPKKYFVLPFQDERGDGCAMIEVYPREILWLLDLPDRGYKGNDKKTREKAQILRRDIVNGLLNLRDKGAKFSDCPRLGINNTLKGQIIASEHAVDALAACYAAALYFTQPKFFTDPLEPDNLSVLLEGWIYSPAKLNVPAKA